MYLRQPDPVAELADQDEIPDFERWHHGTRGNSKGLCHCCTEYPDEHQHGEQRARPGHRPGIPLNCSGLRGALQPPPTKAESVERPDHRGEGREIEKYARVVHLPPPFSIQTLWTR